jgi:hypothetical protein
VKVKNKKHPAIARVQEALEREWQRSLALADRSLFETLEDEKAAN